MRCILRETKILTVKLLIAVFFFLFIRSEKIYLIGNNSPIGFAQVRAEEQTSKGTDVDLSREYYLKGKEFIDKGEYQKANEAFKKAQAILDKITEGDGKSKRQKIKVRIPRIKKTPDKEKVQYVDKTIVEEAGKSYFNGDIDQALNLYKEALMFYPENYALHYNLGVVYLKKRDYLNAAKEFEAAVSLNSRDAGDAYYNLGAIYESFLNNKEKATKYYKKYLKISGNREEKKMVRSWLNYLNYKRIK
ncbi:MAG: tetratricopeptide repeat protein [Candidatus Omnitrophica bacterium]|nr:tetratricopeptide repeat protein [Candidatus Omnitrophota bacterium]